MSQTGGTYLNRGAQDIRHVRVLSATVIAIGDLCWLDTATGTVKPANSFTWTTNLATTQANFAAVFLGIATSASANGETSDVSVDVSGYSTYQIGCVLNLFETGDMLAPAQDGSNSLLSSSVVQKTATVAAAIGRAYHYVSPAGVSVTAQFASAYTVHSTNKNSLIGA